MGTEFINIGDVNLLSCQNGRISIVVNDELVSMSEADLEGALMMIFRQVRDGQGALREQICRYREALIKLANSPRLNERNIAKEALGLRREKSNEQNND